MPLTRHLYVVEEVEAALSYVCSGRNETTAAVFWCQELLHSGYGAETVSLLFRTWVWQKGSFGLHWLLDIVDQGLAGSETTEEAILYAADRLRALYALRDHSLWHLLVLESEPLAPTDRLTHKPFRAPSFPSSSSSSSSSPASLFLRACHQHKTRTAWYLARSCSTEEWNHVKQGWMAHVCPTELRPMIERVDQILTEYSALLGYSSEVYDRVMRALLVCIFCMTPDALRRSLRMSSVMEVKPCMDPIAARFLQELAGDYGCQRFRRFSVPPAALYGITVRGRMHWTASTMDQLNRFESYVAGCPYWDEMGLTVTALDALGRWVDESLYEVYLIPEHAVANVPDEWTLAEKQKSHGEGVLAPTESVRIEKYVRTHLARSARLAWNTTETMLRVLRRLDTAPVPCDPESILAALAATLSATSPTVPTELKTITPCRRSWHVHG